MLVHSNVAFDVPEAPQYVECDTCDKLYDFETLGAIEGDKCHHCQHLDGEISDKMLMGYMILFGEAA